MISFAFRHLYATEISVVGEIRNKLMIDTLVGELPTSNDIQKCTDHPNVSVLAPT